ncbi:MAG: asparagine synthetase B [Nitrososphaerota archaeon]|jgi:asparagine synthase (glutamine-hydrolysing)|nr:asparagine synthetase B [Nitrososphaerota archaeon]
MRTTIAVFNKKGKSALPVIIDALKSNRFEQPLNFAVANSEKMVSHKSPDVLSKQGIDSSLVVGCSFTKEAKKAYSFLQLENATVAFEHSSYTQISKEKHAQEAIAKSILSERQLQDFIRKIDGDYLFFLLKKEELIMARDPIGVQPLYYGENKELTVFASNRKTLWQLGIESEPLSFPPGNLCLLNSAGLQFKPIKTFTYTERSIQISIDDAAIEVQKLLEQAVRARVAGLKEVAVAFSGGLDSGLIAYMASKCGVKVNLIHVSLENELETEAAFEASEKLDLPMQAHLFKERDVENTLPHVLDLIEEADPVKAAIGVSVYWTARKAQETGYGVLLAGQGADEVFGGYQRYINDYYKEGREKVQQTLFNDVVKIHENNLERDKKICINFDVELLLPFCSFDLIEYVLGLPVELKFDQTQGSLRKLVLRKVALNLGLPVSIANKPKKAAQYSTGINNAVKRIAQKDKQTVNEYITKLFQKSIQH